MGAATAAEGAGLFAASEHIRTLRQKDWQAWLMRPQAEATMILTGESPVTTLQRW